MTLFNNINLQKKIKFICIDKMIKPINVNFLLKIMTIYSSFHYQLLHNAI